MNSNIEVGMGRGVVERSPHIITSLGLGSCVVVTLYDTQRKIGGLAHIMLPDSVSVNGSRMPYKCAYTAIAELLKRLSRKGVAQRHVVAKIVGGARMFSDYGNGSTGIGEQNIGSLKDILRRERIPLVGEDTGGNYGRNVQFHLDSGKVIVSAIGKEDREM